MRAERARSLAPPLTEMLAALGTSVLLWYGARLVIAGDVTGAQFVGFLGLSLKLYAPLKNVAKFPATAQPGLVAAERVFEFLDARPEIEDAADAQPIHGVEREIAYESVSFAYREGEPALHDVSFRCRRARCSPSSARADPERARWSTCWAASSTCPAAGSRSTASTSGAVRLADLRASHGHRVAGDDPLPRHGAGQHRLRRGRTPPTSRSRPRRARRTRTSSSSAFPTDTTRASASAAFSCPAASDSASRSRGRS